MVRPMQRSIVVAIAVDAELHRDAMIWHAMDRRVGDGASARCVARSDHGQTVAV